eukprot:5529383-Amphidinium_carterae.1
MYRRYSATRSFPLLSCTRNPTDTKAGTRSQRTASSVLSLSVHHTGQRLRSVMAGATISVSRVFKTYVCIRSLNHPDLLVKSESKIGQGYSLGLKSGLTRRTDGKSVLAKVDSTRSDGCKVKRSTEPQ